MNRLKLLQCFLFIFVSVSIHAQISVSTDTAYYQGFRKNKPEQCYTNVLITNTDTINSVTAYWSKTNDHFLSGWSGLMLMDNLAVYLYDTTWHLFTLSPGQAINLTVIMNTTAAAVDGCSDATITIHESGVPNGKTIFYQYCTWPTATANVDTNPDIVIYPNPVMNNHVKINLNSNEVSGIQLLNSMGQLIESFNLPLSTREMDLRFKQTLNAGCYILQLLNSEGNMIKRSKLLVE